MGSAYHIMINGRRNEAIDPMDRGLHYGDGLFETFAICRGNPLLWDDHWRRLQHGCEVLGMACPEDRQLQQEIQQLCGQSERAVLKLVLTRGPGERGYATDPSTSPTRILLLGPWPQHDPAWADSGIHMRLCDTRLAHNPQLAGIKHLNRLEQVLARREWGDAYQEGLMLDQAGNVIEGVVSNVFIAIDGVLMTPDLTYCGINGIMRNHVLAQARNLGISCHINSLTLEHAQQADEIFVTNSIIGIWPVRQCQQQGYPVGPLTRQLQTVIRDVICTT